MCSTSRAGLLTGRHPVRILVTTPFLSTGDAMNIVKDVLGRYSYNVQGFPQDEVIISEVLKRRGYHTGHSFRFVCNLPATLRYSAPPGSHHGWTRYFTGAQGADSVAPQYLFYYDTRTLVAVRHEHWKYHRRYRTDNAGYWPLAQGLFLFDLFRDPNESYSLVELLPQQADEMASMLEEFEKDVDKNLQG